MIGIWLGMPPNKSQKRERYGGYSQNLQAEEHERSGSSAGSSSLLATFATFIVVLWSWGLLSPQRVQKFSQLVCDDIETVNELNARRLGVPISESPH